MLIRSVLASKAGALLLIGGLLLSAFSASRSSRHSFKLFDDMTDIEALSPRNQRNLFWFDSVSSTMDTARDVIRENKVTENEIYCVVADKQSNGRGTKGRKWFYGERNIYMTVIVHRKLVPIPLHLLPLRTGTLVASGLSSHVMPATTSPPTPSTLTLKWPNDILIDRKKLCGILIEMDSDYFLIGIGCNLVTAPVVPEKGREYGRPSTALIHYNAHMQQLMEQKADHQIAAYCDQVITDIFKRFLDYFEGQYDRPEQVIQDFQAHMDLNVQKLRKEYVDKSGGSASESDSDDDMSHVQPLYLNPDGTLRVRLVHNEEEVTLVAEYLR